MIQILLTVNPRPLPEEMFFYARADTHFLLYIYDHMRNELIDKTNPEVPEENLIELVLQKSKETSLLRYERTIYNAESGRGPGGWYSLLVKTPALLNNEQFAVFRAVHEWRDKVARADDDSPTFVMPQHVLFSMAKLMPMDMVALLGIAHPVSHSVKSRAGELLALIKSAKAKGISGPSMIDVLRPDSVGVVAKANLPAVAASNGPPKTLVAVFDTSELRSESSTFWGEAFGSSLWDSPTLTHGETLRLAVPLPALSSEIFTSSNGLADRSAVRENSDGAEKPTNQLKKEDKTFVIKRGTKRKGDATSDDEESEVEIPKKSGKHHITLDDIAAARVGREKAAQRAARKAEKRARKAAKRATITAAATEVGEAGDALDIDNEEPFDYSKADSVLHGKWHDSEKGGKKTEKPFDPYRKSEDTPKAMRRLQTEKAGKSHTFKS
jgi:exosome complex exonuclease RRP6